ncbi:MAG TPA: 16S rRNA (adenine(1518)-N(6)/adenine(1519)-N(6))-dimethyltransferase RsmA [Kiritimatiellia bacterium]|nr:16S rRNA (adenine(1518)-N(6)/adenine(1519)-N(6))-dimethyltransferase RsmA [Kiritimatiellia bacterium]
METPRALNLTKPSEVRAFLRDMGFQPSRILGQNFLIDRNILDILLDQAHLTPHDRVLEVGPGLGVVTQALCDRSAHVVAIEKDRRLAAHLRTTLAHRPNLTLIEADATSLDLPQLLTHHSLTKFVANLPYSVGTRVLVDCLHAPARPTRIVITLQREVADRIVAPPGTPDFGLLSLWSQLDYTPRLHKVVANTCFYPPPQIQSAIVVFEPTPRNLPLLNEPLFRQLAKHAFSGRRKQIQALLRTFPPSAGRELPLLQAAAIPPEARPEIIPLEAWSRLANAIASPA